MTEYIVFWKDAPGQQVSTVFDAVDDFVRRDEAYVKANGIPVLSTVTEVLNVLSDADGHKYAVTPELATQTLGWEL